jgi:putative ABC transport system substrate-binding protein
VFVIMKRRKFIALFGAIASSAPLAALAQKSAGMRRIGVLIGLPSADPAGQAEIAAFREGLAALGWADHNVKLEYRWPGADPERLRVAAQELAALNLEAIVTRGTPATLAVRDATSTTPIVFVIVAEPIESGLVTNLSRPGGRITGFTNFEAAVSGKWLELLKQVSPNVRRIALMYNPRTAPFAGAFLRSADSAARTLGIELVPTPVESQGQIEGAIASLGRVPSGGLVTLTDTSITESRDLIIAMAAVHRVPAVYGNRNFASAGGLMAYAVDYPDLFRRSTGYIDRILKGAKPADLPVQAPTRFELIVNLKTARQLGLTMPPTLLATADEVIE